MLLEGLTGVRLTAVGLNLTIKNERVNIDSRMKTIPRHVCNAKKKY